MVPASALRRGTHLQSSLPLRGIRARASLDKGRRRRQQQLPQGTFTSNVGWVLRQDGEFLAKALEPATTPLRRIWVQVSKVLGDFFWLRFLEDEQAATQWSPPTLPSPSYPGLSGMELLFSDIEALREYGNYIQRAFRGFSVPLPETYDQPMVEHYFSCRPHIVAVRVLEVLFSFGNAAIQMKISRNTSGDFHEEDEDADSSQYLVGELLKESMLNLGPTFIKVGQSLSTRPDLIGSGTAKALSELHDRVPPFPRSVAMKIIEDELGCSLDQAFSYISDETIAAASFGQVYRGCTHDGSAVAIKVQRPDLLHPVQLDIYILRLWLGILRKIAKRNSDIRLYADELGKGFVGELDYRLEASNAIEFKEAHANYPFIVVPNVHQSLTRKKVLTMEWLEGDSPRDLLALSKGPIRGKTRDLTKQKDARRRVLDLVNKGVEATLVQLLDTGVLHADPHPGNLCYTPDGRLGFLDFGLLSRMEKRHKTSMLASIVHIVNGDWGALIQDLAEMGIVPPNVNTRRVTMDLEEALGMVTLNEGIPDIKFSKVLGKILSVAFQYNFRMPPYYVLVLRSLASLEGLAVASDQEFKSFQAAYPYVAQKLLYDNSAATRGILYSVVFNKRREFQWKKIALFLRLGSSRLSRDGILRMNTSPSNNQQRDVTFDITLLILKLITSKDGLVVRRILMDGNASSLGRAAISREAQVVRQYVSRALADVIYRWAVGVMAGVLLIESEGQVMLEARDLPSGSLSPLLAATIRDRRVKVIVSRLVSHLQRHRILALRVCLAVVAVCFSSSALAFRWVLAWFLHKYVTLCLPSTKVLPSATS